MVSPGNPNDTRRFGSDLDLDGDTLVVGDEGDDPCGQNSGRAWVFERDDGGTPADPCDDTWVADPSAPLLPSNCVPDMGFGNAVDLDGDRVAIGAFKENSPELDRGAVYVFERSGGTWTQTARLLAPDGRAGDNFGWAVALEGNFLLATAPHFSDTPLRPASVYAFELQGGMWTFRQSFVALGGDPDDHFGWSLAMHDGLALVGANADDDESLNGGGVYVFRRIAGSWLQQHQLTPGWSGEHDRFGASVSLDDRHALVGAPYDDVAIWGQAGSAWALAISEGNFHHFGFGDGSGIDCPCDNNSPVGFAAGCVMNSGNEHGAELSVAGSDSAAADDFRMIAAKLRSSEPALLYSGQNLLPSGQGVVFGNGIRLIGAPVVRHGVHTPNFDGIASWGPGLGPSAGWTPGSTVHFQVWFRDGGWCVDQFNFTNGISITFQP